MPDPKLGQRGSVANMINSFHKLEYESGRMDTPASPKARRTLGLDHPAQRPRGDRPVPFHEKPNLKHVTIEPKAIDHSAHRYQVPDLSHCEGGSPDHDVAHAVQSHHEAEIADKPNPFIRRDSTGSSMSSPPHRRRESLSHKAFARVRTMSPPLAMPVPRVEVSPWHETAEQYITRKLTERWSPHVSRSASVASSRMANSHVDAPLVQDILQNIDKILTEHTGTLRDVIDDSRRVLLEKEVLCVEDDAPGAEPPLENGHALDDWRSQNSSVPDLIAAIDRTATHLGITLPEQYQLHRPGERLNVSQEHLRALSPISLRQMSPYEPPSQLGSSESRNPHRHNHVHYDEVEHHHQHSPYQPQSYYLHGPGQPEIPSQRHSLQSSHHASHRTPRAQQSEHSRTSTHSRRDSSSITNDRRKSHPQHDLYPVDIKKDRSPRTLYLDHSSFKDDSSASFDKRLRSHDSTSPYLFAHNKEPEKISPSSSDIPPGALEIEQRMQMSASPAFVEYDRFAALADRASRNSITDLMDSAAMGESERNAAQIKRSLEQLKSVPEEEAKSRRASKGAKRPSISRDVEPVQESQKVKVGESWMKRSTDQSKDKGKLKRVTTMDKVKEKHGYENPVKRVKQAEVVAAVEPKPIAKAGKRETQKMMDSLLARQERDKSKKSSG